MPIKLIHTADLHFGKKLHGFDLLDQQQCFINWLRELIKSEGITFLVVAGDVFDLANPSSESMKMYFEMLREVSVLGCKIIITGGNHDSPALLNAPAELLKAFNILVTGSAPQNLDECIYPVIEDDKIIALIAAVPYLRDTDIRKSIAGESYSDKLFAVKSGIKAYYDSVAEHCKQKFPGIPVIATGHLYAAGSETSDSEREIQIGNLAGVDQGTFSDVFTYVALGHIHKPQQVGNQSRIFYSGSPYPLSFSERSQKKFIRLVEISDDRVSSRQVEIPAFRELLRFTGSFEEIKSNLLSYSSSSILPDLAELEIREEKFDTAVLAHKENLVSEINTRKDLQIIFSKVEFLNQPVFDQQSVKEDEDLSPSAVFRDLLKDLDEDQQMELMVAFSELTESLNEDQA